MAHIEIAVTALDQVGQARRAVDALAVAQGLDPAPRGRLGIAATELATNLAKYGRSGVLMLRPTDEGICGVELIALDRGPGMDLDLCLRDGYSSAGSPGTGLGALRRLADEFDIWSDASGSIVLCRIYAETNQRPRAIGVICRPVKGESVCGDAWLMTARADGFSAMVVDGLGHGASANAVAVTAVDTFRQSQSAPQQCIEQLHIALRGSRGGAAAVASIDDVHGTLRYCAVGNISGFLFTRERGQGLLTHNGIVGGQFHRSQQVELPFTDKALLVMHSDGLQTRWNLDQYPGLRVRHPAIIATVLYRDFSRVRDDVTVLVIALTRASA
jgi:anti-sigma regulatory factor (Ser/Thr protein kinase)